MSGSADTARIVALHLGTGSRKPLVSVERAQVMTSAGLEGDRHSRVNGRRQVLLMEGEVLERLGLVPGDVREQVTVRGIALADLGFGDRLRIGATCFEVQELCAPCSRMDEIRNGLRADLEGRRGRFVRVLEGGSIAVGDAIHVERG